MNASAPGKVILFGEHAVVYGKPALVGALSARLNTRVDCAEEPHLAIQEIGIDGPLTGNRPILKFYSKGIEMFGLEPLEIEVESGFPIGAGLGSSGAMACSFVKAVSEKFGMNLTNDDIKSKANEMEKVIHGNPSGIDTTISTFGGFLRYQAGNFEALEVPSLPLVLGFTGKSGDTHETVGHVKKLMGQDQGQTNGIMGQIEEIVNKAQETIYSGNLSEIGKLMDKNHALLQELEVSSPELDNLVQASREAGAYGAKLTGGGGGGCMIALGGEEISEAIKNAGGVPINVTLSKRGVE